MSKNCQDIQKVFIFPSCQKLPRISKRSLKSTSPYKTTNFLLLSKLTKFTDDKLDVKHVINTPFHERLENIANSGENIYFLLNISFFPVLSKALVSKPVKPSRNDKSIPNLKSKYTTILNLMKMAESSQNG